MKTDLHPSELAGKNTSSSGIDILGSRRRRPEPIIRGRTALAVFGIVNAATFLTSPVLLFFFLYGGSPGHPVGTIIGALGVDFFLLISFALPHTALLLPEGRALLARIAPVALNGTIYAFVASTTLIATVLCWRPIDGVVWQLSGPAAQVVSVCYVFSWLFMGAAMQATGPLRQCGIEQWWNAMKGRPTPPKKHREGLYSAMRHPIYTAMFGMIWFTPTMTFDHLLLSVVWSAYLVLGAAHKEARERQRAGDFEEYAHKVPPFPFFPQRSLSEFLGGSR